MFNKPEGVLVSEPLAATPGAAMTTRSLASTASEMPKFSSYRSAVHQNYSDTLTLHCR